MTDYPDWSRLIQVIGSDIMIPIDIQGAYIMMPVDIQAQYVDLDVAITAENIASIMIALTAETMENIKIDINSQTIDDLKIDIDAQSAGIYLQADWAALQGTDKNFVVTVLDKEVDGQVYGAYSVPGTKTLFVCGISFYIHATAYADRDLNQMGRAAVYNFTDSIILGSIGGNGGGGIVFAKPIPLASNKILWYEAFNLSNHAVDIGVTAWGFEI
ncbi:hypothetical protein ES708_31088 [subsurface metagenome]